MITSHLRLSVLSLHFNRPITEEVLKKPYKPAGSADWPFIGAYAYRVVTGEIVVEGQFDTKAFSNKAVPLHDFREGTKRGWDVRRGTKRTFASGPKGTCVQMIASWTGAYDEPETSLLQVAANPPIVKKDEPTKLCGEIPLPSSCANDSTAVNKLEQHIERFGSTYKGYRQHVQVVDW